MKSIKNIAKGIIKIHYNIILVSETHLSRDIDNEDIQLRGFQNPIRVDRNRHGGGVAIFAKPNIYIYICEKPEFHTS